MSEVLPDHAVRAHAVLSASSAERWLECPPSARFCEQFPDRGSIYAADGTLQHELAELALLSGKNATEVEGEYTLKHREAVQTYLDYVRAIPGDLMVEQRLAFTKWVQDGFGTCDAVVINGGAMTVVDYKGGAGVKVFAEENPQLKLYALAAFDAFEFIYGPIEMIKLAIVQPNLDHISEWEISAKDLLAWAENEVKPKAALAWKGEGEFVPGDHCGFCRGKVKCRARAEANLVQVQGEFAPPNTLSDEEIAELLAVAKERAAWYGDLQSHALIEAENGTKFPGWKLVAGRSNRKYRDQEAVAKALTDAGIPAAVIYEPPSLLGITAMEKAITKKVFNEVLSDLVVKPRGKLTLVPSSDPRPEEAIGSAADGFDDLEGQ